MLLAWAFVVGTVIGSFLNVVIHRVPRGQSVVAPPSSCPACGHRLGLLELIPILSWLVQGGRCRHCGARISARYPLVEALTGGAFALAAGFFPRLPELLLVWVFLALLIALAFIDADHLILPDSLTYGGLAVALGGALAFGVPQEARGALEGALLASGLLVLIGEYGALVARRGASGRPSWPVGFPEVHLAAAVGAFLGPVWGVAAGLGRWGWNWATRRTWPLPDLLPLSAALLAPLLAALWPGLPLGPLESLEGLLLSAGAVALLGGLYWAVHPEDGEEDAEEVVVMGFGDVKFAGMLGAWLGFWPFVVGLFLAVLAGALLGLLFQRRRLPFGPYLALGGAAALFWGEALIRAYLGWLGVS